MQRLELFDVVRIARLDVADRPYGDSGGSMRAPRLGDEGTVVWVDEEGPARGRALVECVADDGMTIWLADFAEHELELVARGVEVGKPKRHSVRRASLWLLAAIAVMATAWIGFVTIDHRQGLFVLPMVGALAGLTVFLAALIDLGKALVELPAPTRLQRALGLVLRAPLAVLGLFCVLTAIAIVVYGVHAIVSGATNDLRMGLLLPVVLGSFGVRWLRQAFHRQPGVAPKERGSTSPRR